MTTFSGPILSVAVSDKHQILLASGNCVYNESNDVIVALNPSTIVHSIRVSSDHLIAHGGREIAIVSPTSTNHLNCRDWILSTLLYEKFLFCVTMHNRVEVYLEKGDGDLITTISCPIHALLYSAEIRITQNNTIQVFGGGVLSSLYVWEFVWSNQDESAAAQIVDSKVYNSHRGSIFRIRSKGDELITTSDDRTVILWKQNVLDNSFIPLQVFANHLARVWDAIWFQDKIVSACEDSIIRIFNRDGKCVGNFSGHSRDVRSLTNIADTSIVSGGEDGCVREWSPRPINERNYKLPMSLKDWIRHVEIFHNSIVSVTALGTVFIDSVPHISSFNTICAKIVSSQYVVLGLANGGICFFDLGKLEFSKVVDNLVPQRVCSICELRKNGQVLVCNHAGDFAIVDINDGLIEKISCQPSLSGCVKIGTMLCCIVTNTEDVFLGDDRGSIVRIRGGHASLHKILHNEKILSLKESGDLLIITTSNANKFYVDKRTMELSSVAARGEKNSRINFFCDFNNDFSWGFSGEDFVIVDSRDQTVLWSYKCGGHRRPYDFTIDNNFFKFVHASNHCVTIAEGSRLCRTIVEGFCGDLIHSMICIDENILFTACEDNAIRRIDLSQQSASQSIVRVHEGSVRSICLLKNAKLLVSGGARSQVFFHTLDESSHHITRSYPVSIFDGEEENDVRIMGIAAIGSVICFVDSVARITLFDIEEMEVCNRVVIPEINTSVTLCVAVNASNFFIGAGNGFVAVMNLDGIIVAQKRLHQNGVNAIACMTDSDFIVSVSDDQSMAVWRVVGNEIETLANVENASSASIRAVTIKDDLIYITGTDRRVKLWRFDGIKLVVEKTIMTSVTDPLALVVRRNGEVVVGGRGIQILSYID